ncbi:hypothetical protein E2542_SST00680 [Spatholobus suberectus]|nr:hypothetical protein E2542_SST00680 [Spatholobus suberectus]
MEESLATATSSKLQIDVYGPSRATETQRNGAKQRNVVGLWQFFDAEKDGRQTEQRRWLSSLSFPAFPRLTDLGLNFDRKATLHKMANEHKESNEQGSLYT